MSEHKQVVVLGDNVEVLKVIELYAQLEEKSKIIKELTDANAALQTRNNNQFNQLRKDRAEMDKVSKRKFELLQSVEFLKNQNANQAKSIRELQASNNRLRNRNNVLASDNSLHKANVDKMERMVKEGRENNSLLNKRIVELGRKLDESNAKINANRANHPSSLPFHKNIATMEIVVELTPGSICRDVVKVSGDDKSISNIAGHISRTNHVPHIKNGKFVNQRAISSIINWTDGSIERTTYNYVAP